MGKKKWCEIEFKGCVRRAGVGVQVVENVNVLILMPFIH